MRKELATLLTAGTMLGTAVAEVSAQADIGGSEGFIRAEFVELASGSGNTTGEILVYRVADSSLAQRIPIPSFVPPRDNQISLEFVDLTDDGYKDLLFHNSTTGVGGAALAADVFLWVPSLGKFVRSKTLSQAGEISKAKGKGCVHVMTKCSSLSWQTRELCFSKATGTWRVVHDDRCSGPSQ